MSLRQRFSILRRLRRGEEFDDIDEVHEFERRLGILVEKGVVEVVPVRKHRSSINAEAWFHDKRTGAVFRYVKPDFPSRGHWGPVEKPEEPSFFESLCPDNYPSENQYTDLVRQLDAALEKGEIECGHPRELYAIAFARFYHSPTSEIYELSLADPTRRLTWHKPSWMKVFGSWPCKVLLGPPPWRVRANSALAGLSPIYPTPDEYQRLVASLDDLWQKRVVLCGQLPEQEEKGREKILIHHPATDETFHLSSPPPEAAGNPEAFDALWAPTPRVRSKGAWPGDLVVGPPPWRDRNGKKG